jgi:DNA polymerase III sliding clamp (beta) subunit (PCNA family)
MNRKDLLQALNRVAPGLSSKESVEQSDCYIFMGDRVVTFNDELAVSFPFDTGIEGAINAKKFYDIMLKLKDKDIGLKINENELQIKAKKSRGGIRVYEHSLLFAEEFRAEKQWIPIPHGFEEALKFCIFTVSKDENMGILMGVHVSQHYIESTDNYRVSRRFYQDLEMPFDDFVIPAASAIQLCKYELAEIYVDEAWAHFRTSGNTEISCRILYADYPNLDRFLKEFKGKEIELPDDFAGVVSRAGVFSEVDREVSVSKVRVSLQKETLKIRGEDDIGWFEGEADIEYDGDPIEFYSSPQHLIELFGVSHQILIGKSLIRFEHEGDFIYVTAMIGE